MSIGSPIVVVGIMFGGSILAFAFGLDCWSREGWRAWLGIVLIGVFGAGIVRSFGNMLATC